MKKYLIISGLVLFLANYSQSVDFAPRKEQVKSKPLQAESLLRTVEDFHQGLCCCDVLSKYEVSYGGGLGFSSRQPGVWPKGDVGLWEVRTIDGENVIALIHLLSRGERPDKTFTHSGVKYNFSLEVVDELKINKEMLETAIDSASKILKDVVRLEDINFE